MQLLSYLQTHQHFSRRNIVQWIKKGEIFVNNQKVESIRHSIEPGDSITKKNDRSITIEKVADIQKQILLFNKPKGYVVSKSDPHNTTIYELLPEKYKDYYYIGRLDKESRGLLLLTNTPEIIHLYEHPKFNKKKEYLIQLSSSMSLKDIQQAKHGIKDEGELLKCVEITPTKLPFQYKVILNEGKKRHIRRMIKALGYTLLDLQRTKEGEYELGDLKEGKWKEINIE